MTKCRNREQIGGCLGLSTGNNKRRDGVAIEDIMRHPCLDGMFYILP